jgi:formylglycine-generating enzyme required for sulfatase activity
MGSSPSEINALVRQLDLDGAGEFDKFAARSAGPKHAVRLTRPFYLARSEVTLGQFRRFIEATGYRSTLEAVKSPPFTWKSYSENAADEEPVCGVSWDDARAFCRWLSDRHRAEYDLPSEAQWEYACRAGSAGLWSFGDERHRLVEYAVCESAEASPAAVCGKLPNAFGLYDMLGNVDEWCRDWHRVDYYSRSAPADPVCLEDSSDPASGRVSRGGSWSRAAWWTRSASRCYDFPSLPTNARGFRVAIVGDLKAAGKEPAAADSAKAEAPAGTP